MITIALAVILVIFIIANRYIEYMDNRSAREAELEKASYICPDCDKRSITKTIFVDDDDTNEELTEQIQEARAVLASRGLDMHGEPFDESDLAYDEGDGVPTYLKKATKDTKENDNAELSGGLATEGKVGP